MLEKQPRASPKSRVKNVVAALDEINVMNSLGFQIMDLYSARHTECFEQFEQLKAARNDLRTLSYAEIDRLYHDGAGLVVAPRNCYKAHSLVVHPSQVAAFIREGQMSSDADTIEHELNEVIERADALKEAIEK